MGRAGAGSGGGSRSSGSHSSSSRSSGGHSVGSSSSRAGNSRSTSSPSRSSGGSFEGGGVGGSFRGSPGYSRTPPPSNPRRRGIRSVGGMYQPATRRRSGIGCLTPIIIAIIIFAVVFGSCHSYANSSASTEIPASTYDREALTNTSFNNNCVIDELGWISNISSVEKQLQNFFNETGVQPYVYFKEYDASLTTDAEKNAFAEDWYENNIDNEYTFLWVYFADEDAEDVVGYMCYVNGYQVSSVIDSEAIDIFWAYVDSYWYSNLDTDDMIVEIFDSTAERIMQHTTTTNEIILWIVCIVGAIIVAIIIIYIMKLRRKHEKERNEETERILNTPLDK